MENDLSAHFSHAFSQCYINFYQQVHQGFKERTQAGQ